METHEYLAEVYEATDSLKKSLVERKAYGETREKYLKTLSKAQRLELERESEEKSRLIQQQQESLFFLGDKNQQYFIITVLLIACLVVFLVIYFRSKRNTKLQSIQLKNDKALLENENEGLKDKLSALAAKAQYKEESKKEETAIKQTSLSPQTQQRYMQNILDYMEQEKPFLNPDIKQLEIANALDMSVHLFSEVLNTCFQKNFNNFINLYRVDKAKQLMKSKEHQHFKVLAIGYEAGFPSKTSFNRVFRNLTGFTPTEYKEKEMASVEV